MYIIRHFPFCNLIKVLRELREENVFIIVDAARVYILFVGDSYYRYTGIYSCMRRII